MWQPMNGPCGTIKLAKIMTCVNIGFIHMPTNACPVIIPTHMPHHCMAMRHHLPCTDCTINKILHVWKNEQNTISFSYDICLSSFNLHWVHDNEAYASFHFEVIPIEHFDF
jgi:hypothetical protein